MLLHTATSLFIEERGNSVISVPQLPGNQGEGKWCSPLSSALAGPFPRSEGGRETSECTGSIAVTAAASGEFLVHYSVMSHDGAK